MSNGRDDVSRRPLRATEMGWLFAALMAAMPIARATTFTVTSTADTGGSTCAATCTLRQAINAANAAAGADVIHFNIGGAGVHSIKPGSLLPEFTSPVTIDGYTQPGSSVNTASVGSNAVLQIEIDGSNLVSGSGNGLTLAAGSAPSTVRGLVINDFSSGSLAAIGYTGSAAGGVVKGCFLGTDATGTFPKLNSFGIRIGVDYTGVAIGGTALADRNLISGNLIDGVQLNSASNTLQGNLIGIAADGSSLLGSQPSGVRITASGNLVGGTSAGAGNVIAGGSTGVRVSGSAASVTIEGNSIYANSQLGIDLSSDGVTANDAGDGDSGTNNLQNYPVPTFAGLTGSTLFLQGTLNSTPSRSFRIEFFMSDAPDPSGYGEGQKYIGSQTQSTDGAGNLSFFLNGTVPGVATRKVITMTATDTVTGDTSEFSTGATIISNTTVINTNDSGAGSLRQAILNANSSAGADVIDFAIPGAGVHTIHLVTPLPTISGTVTIDGYTQSGSAPNALIDGDDAAILIEVDGSALSGSLTSGFGLCASNSLVRGLAIGGFPGSAIGVGTLASGALCGGALPAGVVIEGNFIGLAADGTTPRANGQIGVAVFAASTHIGGADAAQRNLVSSSRFAHGIAIGAGSTATTIDGNYVGTDASGQFARGNEVAGVLLAGGASGSIVGGNSPNLVAFNHEGILVLDGSTGNRFFRNSIRDNLGLGIDLCGPPSCAHGVTPNDTDDADSGGNNLQNFPVITALARTPAGLSVSGSLDRPATGSSLSFAIGVYANTVCDPSGFGQGERYLGTFNFVSANSGVETFTNVQFPTTAALPVGTKITMTATDPAGNTSEFSHCAELDTAAQTFVVNSTLDIDDENCTTAVDGCTLREAISAANARVGADFISFNIPGAGVHLISPASPLPSITDAVAIDGYTQPGAVPNALAEGDNAKLLIQLDGTSQLSGPGIGICSNDVTIRGLSVTRFDQDAVQIGNGSDGLFCGSFRGARIEGNFLGLAPDGSAAGNSGGFGSNSSVANVGGAAPADRNVVSANAFSGIAILQPTSAGTKIAGNYIGTDPSGGLNRGNGRGVSLGNSFADVTDISVGGASPNRIAFNGTGILVAGMSGASVLFANDFFANTALAIDLSDSIAPDGATANDPDDGDEGGNGLQNFPVLTGAVQDGANMHVFGSLDVPAGAASNSYSLAFYANTSCNDASARGEGEMYLGYANVELNGASQVFDINLPVTAPPGSSISSTATSAGGTSEFSTCVTLTAGDHIFANGFD
jgi:CSLREA domain-containing protein